MSKVMTPDQIVAQLRKWRVPFAGEDGWRTRGRPASLGWGDMHGIANHHTATSRDASAAATNRLLRVGRSDLPGPLAQFGTQRDGVVAIIAAGRANHAGAVRPEVKADFVNDRHVTRPTTTAGETVDANAFLYGNEVHNNGTGEKYPDAQLKSVVLLNAAICDFHDWSHFAASQHKNITARKVDMADIHGEDADSWLLREVKVALAGGPGTYQLPWERTAPQPVPQEDDIVTPADIDAIAVAVGQKILDDRQAALIDRVRQAVQAELGDENIGALSDRIAAKVAALLPAPAPGTSVDVAAIARAVAGELAVRLQA